MGIPQKNNLFQNQIELNICLMVLFGFGEKQATHTHTHTHTHTKPIRSLGLVKNYSLIFSSRGYVCLISP